MWIWFIIEKDQIKPIISKQNITKYLHPNLFQNNLQWSKYLPKKEKFIEENLTCFSFLKKSFTRVDQWIRLTIWTKADLPEKQDYSKTSAKDLQEQSTWTDRAGLIRKLNFIFWKINLLTTNVPIILKLVSWFAEQINWLASIW